MTTVEQINSTGIFTIERSSGIKVEFKQIENSTNDDIARKVFTIEEVSELRSKLMLITTGTKGKVLVDRFVNIFGLTEQVHDCLMKLTSSGCHLFSKWKVSLNHNDLRPISRLLLLRIFRPLYIATSNAKCP